MSDDTSEVLSAQQVGLAVLSTKLDEVLRQMGRLETLIEKSEDRFEKRFGELEVRVKSLEMQRWILGGAAVAGGTSGIGALLKGLVGG